MYEIEYKRDTNRRIIECGKLGMSLVQMAAELGISRKTLIRWSTDTSKVGFIEAFDLAQTLAQAHMEDIGFKGMRGMYKGFNGPTYLQTMKVRYKDDYSEIDTHKVDFNSVVKAMSDAEINDKLKEMLDKASNPAPKPQGE
jgi:DNA-binding XRE family transcriptional regulator